MTLIFTKQQKQAMLDAVANLSCTPQHLLIDAMKLPTPIPQTSIIKGDAKECFDFSSIHYSKSNERSYDERTGREVS